MNPFTTLSRRRLFGTLFLGLLILLLALFSVRRLHQHPGEVQPPNHVAQEPKEEAEVSKETADASPPQDDTLGQNFRSGGLGLSRTAWELLHSKPDRAANGVFLYGGKTYKVTYQQDIVWRIEKLWEQPGIAFTQARVRIRRYLPLDSRYVRDATTSDDAVVEIYHSNALAQRLSQVPMLGNSAAGSSESEPVGTCVVVYYVSEQRVTTTLFHIGSPEQIDRSKPSRESGVHLPESKGQQHREPKKTKTAKTKG